MRPSHHDALDRWLQAERDDHSADADAALFELFEALPLVAPPAGFADRVLVRAGLQAVAKRDFFASRVARLAVALCFVALSFGALWLPPVLGSLAGLWSFGGLFGGVVRGGVYALTVATDWLGVAVRVWDVLRSITGALTEVLTVPQVMAGLLVCLIASSLAFRFLRDQITGERNWTYVDRI